MWLSSYVDQNQMVLDKMQIPGSTTWIQKVRARAKDLDFKPECSVTWCKWTSEVTLRIVSLEYCVTLLKQEVEVK